MNEDRQQIDRIMIELNGLVLDQVKRIVIGLFHDIVMRTPVDTGCARASWRIGIGSPDTSHEDPAGKYPNAQATALQQTAKLDGWNDLDTPIYITNSLRYIGRLESGHSQQAPSGMVALSIMELANGIRISAR